MRYLQTGSLSLRELLFTSPLHPTMFLTQMPTLVPPLPFNTCAAEALFTLYLTSTSP